MKKFYITFLFVFISLSKTAAQANNANNMPNVTDALSRLDAAVSRSEEEFTMQESYFLGRTVAANITNRYVLFTEKPELTGYLNFICKALAINSQSPQWYTGYFVMILNDPVPNAFATPGGHIFLTLGLIELLTSEDMLAAVIAHEIAHIQLEHGTKNIMQNRAIGDLRQEQERISRSMADNIQMQIFTETVNEITDILFSRGYSQLQEFEADAYAADLLASAGYTPKSILEVLEILLKVQGNQAGGLNSTHPSPDRRIANLENKIARYRSVSNDSARRQRFNLNMGR